MAAISLSITPTTKPKTYGVAFSHRKHLCSSSLNSSSFLNKSRAKLFSRKPQNDRFKPVHASNLNSIRASHTCDVVVVGAGVIGLSIARQFLLESDLSVAVVDAALPCSGATGAGQGYLWMVHKSPESDTWELAMRSHKLWNMLAENLQLQGMNPSDILGWKKTGSLLIGRTQRESETLIRKVEQLSGAGVRATFLPSCDLLMKEPALMVGNEGGAAFLPDDCQLDAKRTVAFIEKGNRSYASEGRYAEFYHEPATCLIRSGSSGQVVGVQTSKNTLYSRKAIIVAAGCWTGSLMHDLVSNTNMDLAVPVMPRKGHLLVLENFNSFKLNHGLMEMGYVDRQAVKLEPAKSGSAPSQAETASISMTATMDVSGNLVLGSSRQFIGFNTEVDESILNQIWDRAGEFFPSLRELSLKELVESREVRVGLRPYMPDGKPVIGPVSGLSNVFLAAGHEGGGLSLALGTAEMVADMVLGNAGEVDPTPFALQDRCRKIALEA